MILLMNCMNIKTVKTILAHSPPMQMKISKRLVKKSGIIFSSNFDRRKVSPLIYIKFWRQACVSTLLYGTELFTLTPSLLTKPERCQQWFLKNIFYVPKFAPRLLLLRLSGLNSVESEISTRKLLFLGRLLTGENMAPVQSEICFR